MLAVVEMSLWPSHSWICFMGTPCFSSRLAQKHPEIEIVDFDFFSLDTFNRCENANDLMVAIDNWKSVHPLLKVVPVRWKFTIPFGILHAPAPSPTVERFLEAIRQVTGAGEELPGGR